MHVVAGMLIVWLGWLLTAGTFLGLGSLVLHILTDKAGKWDFSAAFWCGFTGLIVILQITNLFSGIGPKTSAILIAIGFCSLFLHRSRFAFVDSPTLWQTLLLFLGLIWLSNRALQAPLLDDSGIYHFSSIRWANQMPLPPGLGNLHGHLAFNQSYFLFVAFLNNFPIAGFGHNVANSSLISAGILTIFEKAAANQSGKIFAVLIRLLVPIMFFFAATCHRSNPPLIASPSPDAAVFVVQIVLIAFVLDFLSRCDSSRIDLSTIIVPIVCLISVSISLKLSAMIFAAATFVFVAAFSVWIGVVRGIARSQPATASNVPRRFWPTKKMIVLFSFTAVLGVTWAIRSVIASGYLLYPLTATGLPVDWRIPEHLVRDELNEIRGWARLPVYESYRFIGSWDWIPQWLLRMADRPDIIAPLGLICVCLTCWLLFRLRSPAQTGSSLKPLTALLGVALISLAFWFWNAPDPRFLGAALWTVLLAVVGIVLEVISPEKRTVTARILVWLLWFGVLSAFVRNGLALTTSTDGKLARPIPTPALTARSTRSGLVLYTPLPGSYCWDGPLLCTPFFRPQLELRGNSLANGFRIDESIDKAPDF